ncbi:MAG: sensor histidine kinase [Bacteroidota bacterium]
MLIRLTTAEQRKTLTTVTSEPDLLPETFRMVVHDMRSPLQALVLMGSMDDRQLASQELRHRIRSIGTELQEHLNALVRTCSGPPAREPFDADTVFREILQSCVVPGAIDHDLPRPLPVMYYPKDDFARIIRNLLSNSAEHSGKNPCRISLTWSHRGDQIEFRYTDNCPGFTDRQWERSEIRREAGTRGNGLGIIRSAIEENGGTATLVRTSTGWFFQFRLPDP